MPLPANETVINETDCYCNGTNLTMMVDKHFLDHWLKFDGKHSIRHLSEAAADLDYSTIDKEVRTWYTEQLMHTVAIHGLTIKLCMYIYVCVCVYVYANYDI